MFKNYFKKLRLKQEGQALLLSLLILAGVSAAGIGFATLIINLIQGAENIDNSITAFYGAASGMEQSLYLIKTDRQEGKALGEVTANLESLTETTFNDPALTVEIMDDEITTQEAKRNFFLNKDEFQQIDLYNPDDPFGASLSITDLWISWDNNPLPITDLQYFNGYGTGNEWVEISWTGWDSLGNSYENVQKWLMASNDLGWLSDPGGCPQATSTMPCARIPLGFPNADIIFYQVRVKALYDKIDDLEVKALGPSPNYDPINIPARLNIKTVGKFGRSQQALSASMPWRYPTSGLFDYVIFAEKELKKIPGNP